MIPKANNYKLLDSGKEKMASLTGGRRVLLTIFVSIFLLLVMPLVSAEIETLGIFRTEGVVTLIQNCGNCTYNNVSSVIYPNSTQAIGQVAMSQLGTLYSFNYNKTDALGTYIVNGFGDLDGVKTSWAYTFNITNTGTEATVAQAIIYFIAILLLSALFSFCFYWAVSLPWNHTRDEEGYILQFNDLRYVKLMMWFVSYILLIGISWLAYNITWGLLSFNTAGNIFNFVYWFLISLLFPILVLFAITTVVNFIFGKKLQDAMRGGIRLK